MGVSWWLLCLILVVPFVIALSRANELFVLSIERGKVRVIRGKAPRRLIDDIEDIASTAPVIQRARLRVVLEGGRPMLRPSGDVSDAQTQRLRNTLGTWPLAKLKG